ncbi:hypothetical protein D3C81_2117610 [compost metagenome]
MFLNRNRLMKKLTLKKLMQRKAERIRRIRLQLPARLKLKKAALTARQHLLHQTVKCLLRLAYANSPASKALILHK